MRLFVALLLPEPVVAELTRLQQTLRRRWPDLKYAKPHQLHITVKFLGEVAQQDAAAAAAALRETTSSHAAFDLTLAAAGHFPPRGKPRIVWISAEERGDSLRGSAAALNHAFEHIGVPAEDREFKPHVTIARARGAGPALINDVARLQPAPLEFHVAALALMQSTLRPDGAVYDLIGEAPFRA